MIVTMNTACVVTLTLLVCTTTSAFHVNSLPLSIRVKPSGSTCLNLSPSSVDSQVLGADSKMSAASYQGDEPSLIISDIEDTVAQTQKVRKGSAPEFAIAGDSTVETPMQVAIVAAHFGMTLLNLGVAASATSVNSPIDVVPIIATIIFSVIMGDFGTGVFHWATDNYGSIKTPVFGSVCAAFQGHHVTPWTITFRSFANNVYKICYGTVPALLAVAAVPMEPLTKIFFTLFITWWMISQELHKFSHMRTTPKGIKFFQDIGLILSKKEHGLHHTAPFEGHYCILTGVCNPFLDDSKFFRHLENVVYTLTGNKPNTWLADPELETETRSMYKQQ